jgi:uncharacterized membrane protein YheB (UPF0754 family)
MITLLLLFLVDRYSWYLKYQLVFEIAQSRNLAKQQSRNFATQQSRNLVTQQSRNLAKQRSRNLTTNQSRNLAEAVNFEVDFNKNFVRTTLASLDKYEHTF